MLRILDHIHTVDRIFQHHLQGLPHTFQAPRSQTLPPLERLRTVRAKSTTGMRPTWGIWRRATSSSRSISSSPAASRRACGAARSFCMSACTAHTTAAMPAPSAIERPHSESRFDHGLSRRREVSKRHVKSPGAPSPPASGQRAAQVAGRPTIPLPTPIQSRARRAKT